MTLVVQWGLFVFVFIFWRGVGSLCSSLCLAFVMKTSSIQECNYTHLIKLAIHKVRRDSVRSSGLLRTGVYIILLRRESVLRNIQINF